MKNLEPVIFFAFRALNLVAESNTSQYYLRSTDSTSMKEKKTAGMCGRSEDRWMLGISVWMPDQHSAAKNTVLHSIRKNDCLKMFTKTNRNFKFCQLAVSPDSNFVIEQHGTFSQNYCSDDGSVTLYRFIPNERPQFLQICVRINQFDVGVFHWTRDSRFCLWQFRHARNSVCALELVGRKDGIEVVKHHSLSLLDQDLLMFSKDLITSPDGRYFLTVKCYSFMMSPLFQPLVSFDIYELQTKLANNASPHLSPLLRIRNTNAIGKALEDLVEFDCELGIVYYRFWKQNLEDPLTMRVSPTKTLELNSFSLPIGALDSNKSNNGFLHIELSSSTPSTEDTSRMHCCTDLSLRANPRGCMWAYEKYTISTIRPIIRIVGNSIKRTTITIPRRTCARLVRLRSLPTKCQHVPTLLQLARTALYERPELLHPLECRKDVLPTLLKNCLSLDPLTYMPRT